MHSAFRKLFRRLFDVVESHIKRWLKPSSLAMAGCSAIDVTRSKAELIAENAFLRQQLIILQRQSKRPKLGNRDRLKLLLLARVTPSRWLLSSSVANTLRLLADNRGANPRNM